MITDKPIYLVTFAGAYVTDMGMPAHSVLSFGTLEDAQRYAGDCALQKDELLARFKIVEFVPSGKVFEA